MAVDLNKASFVGEWSPSAEWKQALLIELGRRFNLPTFIETGTCWGATIEAVLPYFSEIYSVELCKPLYESCIDRFKEYSKVNLFYGNSADRLSEILKISKDSKPLIWLDAHPAGPGTADEGDPLPSELQILFEHRPEALILIDDIKPEYRFWQNMNILVQRTDWTHKFFNGILILHRGQYSIPERF
jgi:hypothetical protein